MIQGIWRTVAIAKDAKLSAEVDLGADFNKVLVLIPALDDTEVTIHVARESGGDFFPMYKMDADLTGDFAHATTTLTTAKAIIFECGAQFIKVSLNDDQSGGARTFYARGLN